MATILPCLAYWQIIGTCIILYNETMQETHYDSQDLCKDINYFYHQQITLLIKDQIMFNKWTFNK